MKWINCLQAQSLASPVCDMRLQTMAPSPYNLGCWFDIRYDYTIGLVTSRNTVEF